MRPMVVDCSVTTGWVLISQSDDYTDAVRDQMATTRVFVPGIWLYEAANVLLQAEKRKIITREDSTEFFQIVKNLPLEIVQKNDGEWSELLLWLAKTHQMTVYDTAYLYLAMDRGYPLATRDKKMVSAAQMAGVPIFQP
jgi:predicted nucleic acid-binding protein